MGNGRAGCRLAGLIGVVLITLITGCGKTAAPPVEEQKSPPTYHSDFKPLRGISLTEIGDHLYDAAPAGSVKSEAQIMVDVLAQLGVRHLILSPRATQRDPRGSDIVPVGRGEVRQRYLRLIDYVHGKGMTVGIRPLLFVVDAKGNTPLVDGAGKIWWHGNIEPRDAAAWFASLRSYLDPFLEITAAGAVEEFTLGAELQSMTVGLPGITLGAADECLSLLDHARASLPPSTRVMYDLNYTDVLHSAEDFTMVGGETALWTSILLGHEGHPDRDKLARFWKGLDAVGIDMYRSLASDRERLPEDPAALIALLKRNAAAALADLDGRLDEIAAALGTDQRVSFKEVGYRSVTRGFVRPFEYAGNGELNVGHQAAAYEAFLGALDEITSPRFRGAVLWDASVSLRLHGPLDLGFSPIGKSETEAVIRRFFVR